MNIDRIDKIIQYSLFVASDADDPFDRQLGPIHLIKYVYLADLSYAASNKGEIFTGTKWQFYKFGPWAQEVNNRIEPALSFISAEKRSFPSDYEDSDEWVRWQTADDSSRRALESELPFVIKSTLRRDVRRFGKATPELLRYVYATKPMLCAAPREFLDFSVLKTQQKDLQHEQSNDDALSIKKQKDLKTNLRNLKTGNAERLTVRRKKHLVTPLITPRYDEVYYEGLKWLDSLAGENIQEGTNRDVVFSDAIWKSPSRCGDDFSD